MNDFNIDLDAIPANDKSSQQLDKMEEMAAKQGYVCRAPRRKLGRRRSPRTEQIHTWVHPYAKEWLLAESLRRDVHQGLILEEAFELYKKYRGCNDEVAP